MDVLVSKPVKTKVLYFTIREALSRVTNGRSAKMYQKFSRDAKDDHLASWSICCCTGDGGFIFVLRRKNSLNVQMNFDILLGVCIKHLCLTLTVGNSLE